MLFLYVFFYNHKAVKYFLLYIKSRGYDNNMSIAI